MSIVYMGTSDFAVPPLAALCDAGYDVALVVTKPDKPRDRGKKLQSCPVKLEAERRGLCVAAPQTLKDNEEFIVRIRELDPELIVVAAYGKILPPRLLDIPRRGCVNIHGSLLPLYRGAAPIHRAVIEGRTETGVTLMYMAQGMDTGDMIAKAVTDIGQKTASMLHEELSHMGAALLIAQLPAILSGTACRTPQTESEATYAPMIFKEDGMIDFSKEPREICALVRGMNAWPGASTLYKDQTMKVYRAEPCQDNSDAPPGTILSANRDGIKVSCRNGSVLLKQIQMPGKRIMEVSEYLLGNKIEIGTILG
jgi:methionyl-tRNA formyltransferase